MSYKAEFELSTQQPEVFWKQQAANLPWHKQPTQILSKDDNGVDRWFADGELNISYCALDYHVENGRADQTAVIYDSPVTNTKAKYTYREMRDEVAKLAGGLKSLGVTKGDRVVIYMPMVPQALMAMYACARLGAIHSVVFGGFAPNELAVRIDDAQPKVILAASCGIEVEKVIPYKGLLDEAINLAEHKPEKTIVFQREESLAEMNSARDIDWLELVSQAEPADPVMVEATHPLYVLYTSGTTGKPKGVVRDTGGYATVLKYSMKTIYDLDAGDVMMTASDVGWVVGHSYIVYGPLIAGCTTIIYEGKPVKTPDAGAFWRLIEDYKVKSFFTAPTAFRAVKREDPEGKLLQNYDISSLKIMFLAGERLDPPTYYWLDELLPVPIVDHWWQTETGWPIAGNMMGLEPATPKAGSATFPTPGYNVKILGVDGQEVGAEEEGNVAIKLPLPPGCLTTVWGDHDRYLSSYMNAFPGYYETGDSGKFDEDGYLYIMGRTDDVINVAGHRLSTGEMEEIVASHPAVAECTVVGVADQLRGQLPVGLVITKDGWDGDPEELKQELAAKVRQVIGAIACYRETLIVDRLPKTRSGKILRNVIRNIADGKDYVVPSTIDDPTSIGEIESALSDR